MTREWVNACGSPRISHSPWSGSCQRVAISATRARCSGQASLCGMPSARRTVSRACITSPSTSCLGLLDRAVADPDRPRVGVAGQVVEGDLGQPPRPVDGVHDLHLGGVAGDGAQQPVPPDVGLLGVAGLDQRVEGERGVAEPAVAVVPVALAPEVLGQRGGRGGDDPAGDLVGHQPEGEQGAADHVGVRYVGRCSATPTPRPRRWSPRSGRAAPEVGGLGVRREPGHREDQLVALGDVELVVVGAVRRPSAAGGRGAPAGPARRPR